MVIKFFKSGLKKVQTALGKTRSILGQGLKNIFQQGTLSEAALEDLEQLLYEADLGVQTAAELTEKVQEFQSKNPNATEDQLTQLIREELLQILQTDDCSLASVPQANGPTIFMVVGVNGNGKTSHASFGWRTAGPG